MRGWRIDYLSCDGALKGLLRDPWGDGVVMIDVGSISGGDAIDADADLLRALNGMEANAGARELRDGHKSLDAAGVPRMVEGEPMSLSGRISYMLSVARTKALG